MRYNFYADSTGRIYCTSRYAGKTVRCSVDCHPNDNYNYEKGCEIAKAKVDYKIAEKRLKMATKKFNASVMAADKANKFFDAMYSYKEDAIKEVEEAKKNYHKYL